MEGGGRAARSAAPGSQQVPPTAARFQRTSQWVGSGHGVSVAARAALPQKDARFLELAGNPLHCPLGDAHLSGYLAQCFFGALHRLHQYMSVIPIQENSVTLTEFS